MAEPPSYEADPAEPSGAQALLKPATLYAAQRFIHPSDPQAPPLYELSHSVGFLRNSDRKITLDRFDYSVRTNAGAAPAVRTRRRNIFDLTHRTLFEMPKFKFQAEAQSRATVGSLGMEAYRPRRFGLLRRGYRVVKGHWGPDQRLVAEETLFTAAPSTGGSGDVSWEWSDGGEKLLAREIVQDGLLSLVVTAEMTQETRDALVASWVMRIWWELAANTIERHDKRRTVLVADLSRAWHH